MLAKITRLVRIKLSSGLLFELLHLVGWPWWQSKPASGAKLTINPTYNLNLIGSLTDTKGFNGVRGVSLTSSELVSENKQLLDLFVAFAKCKGNPAKEKTLLSIIPEDIKEMMRFADIVVNPDCAPKVLKYRGKLERCPHLLAQPDSTSKTDEVDTTSQPNDYQISEHFYLQSDDQIPVEIDQMMRSLFGDTAFNLNDIFDCDGPILWCVDPCSNFISPYGLTKTQSDIVASLLQGTCDINSLPLELLKLLIEIEVLVLPQYQVEKQNLFSQNLSAAKAFLADNLYVVLNNHFNVVQIMSQRRYVKSLVAGGYLMASDPQVANRLFIQNDGYCRFMHFQLSTLVNHVMGEQVKPSYSYLTHYYGGAELLKHKDRKQCRWNVSMPLDVFPNTDGKNHWPIYVQNDVNDENSAVEVNLGIGDMVIYRGNKLYHWRNPLEAEKTATICFFHFVGSDFIGSLD